jgi:hypothetical protein
LLYIISSDFYSLDTLAVRTLTELPPRSVFCNGLPMLCGVEMCHPSQSSSYYLSRRPTILPLRGTLSVHGQSHPARVLDKSTAGPINLKNVTNTVNEESTNWAGAVLYPPPTAKLSLPSKANSQSPLPQYRQVLLLVGTTPQPSSESTDGMTMLLFKLVCLSRRNTQAVEKWPAITMLGIQRAK